MRYSIALLALCAFSRTDSVFKGVDAQISFAADGLVLDQNGANLPTKRITE